jgi:co-chaperonin GroES (HSP10)
MKMAKTRNFLLEMIQGPRTYVPPANTMILELVDEAKTKGGLLLPEIHANEGEGMKPLGRVVKLGDGRETWKDSPPPASIGDYVMFDASMYPVIDIHDGMVVVHYDTVMLRIIPGTFEGLGVAHTPEELYDGQVVGMGAISTAVE